MAFPMSKIHQTLQFDSLKHKEQLSFLAQLQMPSGVLIRKSENRLGKIS
jgi:hypothetical protein